MKVGIYLDMRNPPPWRQETARIYGFTLELCEEAERRGIDSIWLSEHHRFEDGYLPQPLTLAAAIAARTTRVRIGTAVLLAPFRTAPQIAEDAAIVDLVSDGRLDLGLGAGYRPPEFDLFGADFSSRYATTDARLREVQTIWSTEALTPAPVQSPLPLWLGYQGPRGARRAGRLGVGLLSASASLAPPYRDGLSEGGHAPSCARMAGGFPGFVTEDPERDWPVVSRHAAYQLDSYRRYMVEGTERPLPTPIDPERARRREVGHPAAFSFATPHETAARIHEFVGDAPVETVFLWASIAALPEPMVQQHVATICNQLAPLLSRPPTMPNDRGGSDE